MRGRKVTLTRPEPKTAEGISGTQIRQGPRTFDMLRWFASDEAGALETKLALHINQADHEAITLALMSAYDQGARDNPSTITIQREAAQ